MNAIGDFLTLIVIGSAIGLIMTRYGRSWLGQKLAGVAGASDATYVLVGIAGSFIGFHLGLIAEVTQPVVLYALAIVGAALTMLVWRGR
jgi:hypothetical protein